MGIEDKGGIVDVVESLTEIVGGEGGGEGGGDAGAYAAGSGIGLMGRRLPGIVFFGLSASFSVERDGYTTLD